VGFHRSRYVRLLTVAGWYFSSLRPRSGRRFVRLQTVKRADTIV
jgi:hypothetical protein